VAASAAPAALEATSAAPTVLPARPGRRRSVTGNAVFPLEAGAASGLDESGAPPRRLARAALFVAPPGGETSRDALAGRAPALPGEPPPRLEPLEEPLTRSALEAHLHERDLRERALREWRRKEF
jgi:hypothetical protein